MLTTSNSPEKALNVTPPEPRQSKAIMGDNQARFDPIWRRIKSDGYTSKLEGPFRDARDRLGELNNWGSLGWLYPHATATKLAHHYGVEHNAVHYLSTDDTRRHYAAPFRIAAHALHWGHPPLSYAGAEGIVRAAHVDGKVQEFRGPRGNLQGSGGVRCVGLRRRGPSLC